jgi:nitrate reductase NapE component
MRQYESVYKNTGATPRTLSQANKDADYATPIYRTRTELDDAKDFFIGLLLFALFVMCFVVLGYGFMVWLDM